MWELSSFLKEKKSILFFSIIVSAEILFFLYLVYQILPLGDHMDKKIRQVEKEIKKDSHKEESKLKELERMDKKRDKGCEMGKEVMKKKKK
jgi:hypothetical protein